MGHVIEELHRDHINLAKLLDLLEEEVDRFCEERNPDYTLMREILDYIVHYPNEYHHPKEDAIFEKLVAIQPEAKASIRILRQDHEMLGNLTRELNDFLQMICVGQVVKRSTVARVARTYIVATRQHMKTEETEIFPLIEENLVESDWSSIEDTLEAQNNDPLLGKASRIPYENLYTHITRWR